MRLLALSAIAAFVSLPLHAQPNTWAQKANLGGSARREAVGFSIGNKGYFGTGTDASLRKDFWEYDRTTNAWTQKADFGGTARQGAVGFGIGAKGYVGTGDDGSLRKDFWEYDPATNTWTAKADFGGNGRKDAVGFCIGSKGYLGTGWQGSNANDFWEYNPTTNAWTQKTNFGGAARNSAVGFAIGTKGYIGTGGNPALFNDFWEYDAGASTWTQKANFGGTARAGVVGFGIGSKGYMGTGHDGANRNDFWEYDPSGNAWTQRAVFTGGARREAIGFSISSKGYLGGGFTTGNVADFWEYTAANVLTCSAAGSTFCADGTTIFNVAYETDISFDPSNIFTAELSDAFGNFGAPVSIGGINATSSGSITATIPQSIVAGTGYRIRVKASQPAMVGSPFSSPLSISEAHTWYADADGDMHGNPMQQLVVCGTPAGYVNNNTDCNDADPLMYVGADCNDGDLCTTSDVLTTLCTCVGLYQDTDGDGTCDADEVGVWLPIGPNDVNVPSQGPVADPSLVLDAGGNPVVAYRDYANGYKTTVIRWNGSTWAVVGTPGISAGVAYFQSLALDANGNPVVAYRDEANGSKTTVMRWNGTTWAAVGASGISAGGANYLSLALDAIGNPVVAYRDEANGSKTTVMRWNGSVWAAVGAPGISAGGASSQSLALDAIGNPVVVYRDEANGYRTTVMRWNGSVWATVGAPGISAGSAEYQSLALDANGTPVVAYCDYTSGGKATVLRWNGSAWVAVGAPGISAGLTSDLSLALDAIGNPVVAYQDVANGHKTTVIRWNGTTWSTVGAPGISGGWAEGPSLALDANGNPVVAYWDYASGGKATVLRWNGSAWGKVGAPGISAGEAYNQSLALDAGGNPVVAYQDNANGQKTTVIRWNGSTWAVVGTPGISAGVAYFQSLALDANGNPVVAYRDEANGSKTTVMRWNGTTWAAVGASGISAGGANYLSLALDASGNPVVAYSDEATGYKTTVMRWNGSAWTAVGAPGISATESYYQSLALDVSGNPVVAYLDNANGYKTTVMRWNGSAWTAVGAPGISAGRAEYQSLALDVSGNPVVAYQDYPNGQKTTLMRWNGSVWAVVGAPGISAGVAYHQSLALDANENPIVAYRDEANGSKTTVMRWNGTAWAVVGVPGFSASVYNSSTHWLQLDAQGNMVVAYGSGPLYAKRYRSSTTTTGLFGGSLCTAEPVNVPYTIAGGFYGSNTFAAQLSDAIGSFATPTTIGSITATTSGTINCTIPINTPPGTGYRIRVVSNHPVVIGPDNGTDITIEAASTWYADSDNDGYGDPAADSLACAQPTGHVTDNTDNCPVLSGRIGDACNDNNPNTNSDVITPSCVCAGNVANDECYNAPALTAYAAITNCVNLTSSSTVGATPSGGSCSPTANDVWFAVETANSNAFSIDLAPIGATDMGIEVFETCGGASVYCASGLHHLVPVQGELVVRVFSTSPVDFTICALRAPLNNEFYGAEFLDIQQPVNCPANGVVGTTRAATSSGALPCASAAAPDVWYGLYPNTGATMVVVELIPNEAAGMSVQLMDATLEDTLYCGSGNSHVIGVAPFTEYYIKVSSATPGDFSICVSFGQAAVTANVRMLLEGPYNSSTGLMNDDLRTVGFFPHQDPYPGMGYVHTGCGQGGAAASVFAVTGNNAIVDYVVLELRDATTPAIVMASRTALLQRDGDVVDLDGISTVPFYALPGNYHVAVRHRNHHGCMTNAPVALGAAPASVDFTSLATATWGTNARKTSGGAVPMQVLWAGDVTFNHAIKYTGTGNDRDPILVTVGSTTPNNVVSNAYSTRDVNLNGQVKYTGSGNDRDPILVNVGSTTPNNVRVEQLP